MIVGEALAETKSYELAESYGWVIKRPIRKGQAVKATYSTAMGSKCLIECPNWQLLFKYMSALSSKLPKRVKADAAVS